jgi:hypothetical protein
VAPAGCQTGTNQLEEAARRLSLGVVPLLRSRDVIQSRPGLNLELFGVVHAQRARVLREVEENLEPDRQARLDLGRAPVRACFR